MLLVNHHITFSTCTSYLRQDAWLIGIQPLMKSQIVSKELTRDDPHLAAEPQGQLDEQTRQSHSEYDAVLSAAPESLATCVFPLWDGNVPAQDDSSLL
jgi:hypothetical protein